jgi:translation initiation factor 2B subunit (eIF-2B alpha/beta/delta family)
MNLFAAIRTLDEKKHIHVIVADDFPDEGLGRAIIDRLTRASYGRKRVKI